MLQVYKSEICHESTECNILIKIQLVFKYFSWWLLDNLPLTGLQIVELPSGIGTEGSGIIKKIGSKVKDFSIGDRVAYAGPPLGSYSTERNYPAKNLVKIPKEIDFSVAAS